MRDEDVSRQTPQADPLDPLVATGDVEAVVAHLWTCLYRQLVARGVRRGLDVEEAEDAVQMAFARLIEQWSTFDGRNVRAWLWKLCGFEILTHRNNRIRSAARGSNVAPDATEGPDDTVLDYEGAELEAIVEDLISASEPVARLIARGIVDRMPDSVLIEVIAGEAGVALNLESLRQRRARVRKQLKKSLKLRGYL